MECGSEMAKVILNETDEIEINGCQKFSLDLFMVNNNLFYK